MEDNTKIQETAEKDLLSIAIESLSTETEQESLPAEDQSTASNSTETDSQPAAATEPASAPASEEEQPTYNGLPKVESTFEDLGVSGEILKAIKEMGYESPMPVQEKVNT